MYCNTVFKAYTSKHLTLKSSSHEVTKYIALYISKMSPYPQIVLLKNR